MSATHHTARESVLTSVGQDGNALEHAASELQADREIVLAAVGQNWRALQYAAPELKADRDFVLAAVKRSWQALEYAAPQLQADHEIVVAAVKQDVNSKDMEEEVHSFAMPQPYINCSKLYSLRVRAQPDLKSDEIGLVHRGEAVLVLAHEGEWCKLKLKASWPAPPDVSCGWARRVAEDQAGVRHVMLEPATLGRSTDRSSSSTGSGSAAWRGNKRDEISSASAAEQRASQVAELLAVRPLARASALAEHQTIGDAGDAFRPAATSIFSTPRRTGRVSMLEPRSRRLSLPASVHTAATNLFAQADSDLAGGSAVVQGGDDALWSRRDGDDGEDDDDGGASGNANAGGLQAPATRGFSESIADGRGSSSSLVNRAEQIAAVSAARAAASAPSISNNRFPGWSMESNTGRRLVESAHPIPMGYTTSGSFTVPGALRLRITFDPRCGLQNVHLEEVAKASDRLAKKKQSSPAAENGAHKNDGNTDDGGGGDTSSPLARSSTSSVEKELTAATRCVEDELAAVVFALDSARGLDDGAGTGAGANVDASAEAGARLGAGAADDAVSTFGPISGAQLVLGTRRKPMVDVRRGSDPWQSLIIEGDTVRYLFQADDSSAGNSLNETWGFAFTVSVETAQPRCIFDEGLGVESILHPEPPVPLELLAKYAGAALDQDTLQPGGAGAILSNRTNARIAWPARATYSMATSVLDRSILDLCVEEEDEPTPGVTPVADGSVDGSVEEVGYMAGLVPAVDSSRSGTPNPDYVEDNSDGTLSGESNYPTTDEEAAASSSEEGGRSGAPSPGIVTAAGLGAPSAATDAAIGLPAILTSDLSTFQEVLSTGATSGMPIEDAVREALRAATERREERRAPQGAFAGQEGRREETTTTTTTTTTVTTTTAITGSDTSNNNSDSEGFATDGESSPTARAATWLDWPLSDILRGLDQKSWAEQVQDAEASTPATNSSPRERSSAMLQVVLEHPGQVSTASAVDVAKGTLILQARELLVDLLACWPTAAQVTVSHVMDDPSVLFGLFCRMQENCTTQEAADRLQLAMHNVVLHGTRQLLDTLIQLSPQCIREPTSKLQIRKVGPIHYSAGDMVLRDQVYIRGASSLQVRFDPSTFRDFQAFHCDRVILASSFDLQSQRHVIDQGYVTEHAGCRLPPITITGSRVYI